MIILKNLGLENRNPINLRYDAAVHYLGLHPTQPNVKGFCRFVNFDYGYRAAVIAVLKLIKHYPSIRVVDILRCMLPLPHKQFVLYVACICGRSRMHAFEQVKPEGMQVARLVAAMARQETGMHPTPEYIQDLRCKFGI